MALANVGDARARAETAVVGEEIGGLGLCGDCVRLLGVHLDIGLVFFERQIFGRLLNAFNFRLVFGPYFIPPNNSSKRLASISQ